MLRATAKIFRMTLPVGICLSSCASLHSASEDLVFPSDDTRGVTYEELSEPESSNRARPSKPGAFERQSSKVDRQACERAFQRIAEPVRTLSAIAGKRPITAAGPFAYALDIDQRNCRTQLGKRQLIHTLYLVAHAHNTRILALLPLSGAMRESGTAILEGMRKAVSEHKLDFDTLIAVRDTGGDAIRAERALAQALLGEAFSAVIGGVTGGEARVLSTWATRLSMPTVLVSPESPDIATSPFVFRVFPNEKQLAQSLVDYIQTRGIKSIGMMRPWRPATPIFIEEFVRRSAAAGIKVAQDVAFNRDDFGSMESAAKKMFRVEASDRPEEFAELVEAKRLEASAAGVVFNQRNITLAPMVDFDAVFIPDNFRTVRHMVQIFKYLGVSKLQLIGTHEWRSPALVEPYDPYLNGAIFADYIGSYQRLPPGIEAQLSSPNFVHPDAATQLDYQLIGYHAAAFLAPVVDDTDLMRREIAKNLGELELGSNQGFFAGGRAFDNDRVSLWPTFLFSVAGKDIVQVR